MSQSQNVSLEQRLAFLEAENAKLRANVRKAPGLSLKVSQKGAISVYGMGRWPVTLYKEQMVKFLAYKDTIEQFMADNDGQLKAKGDATDPVATA